MKSTKTVAVRLSVALLVVAIGAGCRGMQLRELERRIDELESRVSNIEGRMEVRTIPAQGTNPPR